MADPTSEPMDADDARAQLVALELIRKAVADLPLAVARNAVEAARRAGSDDARSLGGRGPAGDREAADPGDVREDMGGPGWARRTAGRVGAAAGAAAAPVKDFGAEVGNMLLAKFAVVLGPLAVFGQVLQSNTSGFQVLGAAVRVLAATLGPILLPVVAILGGALLELSDRLWDELAPALEDFYGFVVNALIPAVEWMIDAFMGAVDAIASFVGAVADAVGEMGDNATETLDAHAPGLVGALTGVAGVERPEGVGRPGGGDAAVGAGFAGMLGDALDKLAARDSGFGPGAGGGADFGFGGEDSTTGEGGRPDTDAEKMARAAARTGDASKAAAGGAGVAGKTLEFLREMRLSFMPKASIGGLGGIGNQAQLAAMNQSGFEAKMLERMDKAITTLERVVAAAAGPPDRVFGDGRR